MKISSVPYATFRIHIFFKFKKQVKSYKDVISRNSLCPSKRSQCINTSDQSSSINNLKNDDITRNSFNFNYHELELSAGSFQTNRLRATLLKEGKGLLALHKIAFIAPNVTMLPTAPV